MSISTVFQNTKRSVPKGRRDKWDALADTSALNRMCALLNPDASDKVLDVGTGKGYAAMALSPKVATVTAVDVVSDAESAFTRAGLSNVRFLRRDLNDGRIPFKSDSFDIVVCRAALHHLQDKSSFFADSFRVLRPHGRLYVMDPVMSPNLRLSWSILGRTLEKDYRGYCTPDELINNVEIARFDIQYCGEFLFPRSLRDWIDSKVGEMQSPLATRLRESAWNVVFDLLPKEMQSELHLDKGSKEGWFAYNCIELLAKKGPRKS